MLLQELKRDTESLLYNLKITREQLETFLKVTRTDLADVLYRKSSYDLLKNWINSKTPENVLFVSYETIEYLQDKALKNQQFTKGEMINCYAYNKQTGNYILCVNSSGHCHISNIDFELEGLGSYCRFIEYLSNQLNWEE